MLQFGDDTFEFGPSPARLRQHVDFVDDHHAEFRDAIRLQQRIDQTVRLLQRGHEDRVPETITELATFKPKIVQTSFVKYRTENSQNQFFPFGCAKVVRF